MRIGELAATAGTTTKTLRFYEKSGLLPPTERAAHGYRDYEPAALSRLDFIRRGQAAGLRLAQIRQVIDIRDAGDTPCDHVHDLLTARLQATDVRPHQTRATRAQPTDREDPRPRTCRRSATEWARASGAAAWRSEARPAPQVTPMAPRPAARAASTSTTASPT